MGKPGPSESFGGWASVVASANVIFQTAPLVSSVGRCSIWVKVRKIPSPWVWH